MNKTPQKNDATLTREQRRTILRIMLTQRAIDNRGFQLNRQGKIAIAMGSEGHEAVHAGAGTAFRRGTDVVYPYYRNTGLLLACGLPLRDFFASQFARASDRTGGRQIINHICARELGIASFSSVIAAHCAHAVGAAHAMRTRGENNRVVFCQFGDGATSEGEWHEAVNFAAVHKSPIVFLCENNRWAISTPQSKQMAVANAADRACAYGIPGVTVDGFDPIAVYDAVRTARARAASRQGPTLVEAQCYRFLSHTTDDDDRAYRTREEVQRYRELDPIPRFRKRLLESGDLTEKGLARMDAEIATAIDCATDEAEREPLPQASELYTNVYEGSHEPWV
jgi:2-oxoisovalerate dehydrogenase E1 component alpha subunit